LVIKNAMKKFELSERRACKIFDQYRTTQRYKKNESKFNEALRARVIELASEYGRYGYRRITALVNREGYHVNHKRVYRIWREEGLKVPQKQPKRGRLWLNLSDPLYTLDSFLTVLRV
jgi:putative transposase